MEDINSLIKKANSEKKSNVTYNDCMRISKHVKDNPAAALPTYCENLLRKGKQAGILARRNTAVGKAWDFAEGHGKRTIYEENVPGGIHDKPETISKSASELYMESKDPVTQAKIREKVIRMASRGAHPRMQVPDDKVKVERERDLKRRMTRRKTLTEHHKSGNRPVFAASAAFN